MLIGKANSSSSHPGRPSRPRPRAFSLVELIAVMAILVVMLSLLAPAIGNMASTAGRKGAVTTLMNTFEQARVAALESGANVTVILWRRAFPEVDSIMVVRERLPWDSGPAGSDYVQLTKWIKLPEKTLFYSQQNTIIPASTAAKPTDFSFHPPGTTSSDEDRFSYVQFKPTGVISFPNNGTLALFVTEGVRDDFGNEARVAQKKHNGLERIAFARYTGRATLDVTQTATQ